MSIKLPELTPAQHNELAKIVHEGVMDSLVKDIHKNHYSKMKKDWQEIVENINRDPDHIKLRDHFRETARIPDNLLKMRLG
jgi:hypothetical protein